MWLILHDYCYKCQFPLVHGDTQGVILSYNVSMMGISITTLSHYCAQQKPELHAAVRVIPRCMPTE